MLPAYILMPTSIVAQSMTQVPQISLEVWLELFFHHIRAKVGGHSAAD